MSLLKIEDLVIHFKSESGDVHAVNGVSLSVDAGKTLGLVGETGAGKTTTALGILRLVPEPGEVLGGTITYKDKDIMTMSEKEVQDIRGNEISMIFQDPMTALNPVMTVGDQVAEVILRHQNCTKVEAQQRMIDILGKVGIGPDRAGDYPHQFSGGMKQRIVIAIALACEPDLLIADEPTTALDVTIQAQILDMMRSLQKEHGTSMILITHDLGVVAEMCDHCAVMYAGEIVEYGTVEDIFDNPKHPYTKALYQSIPSLDRDVDRLHVVPGMVTDPSNLPDYCSFADRCEFCSEECKRNDPKTVWISEEHSVKCSQYAEQEEK